MKLIVTGFKTNTLLKHPMYKTQPLMGLGKTDRKTLNIRLGVTQINETLVKVVPGKDGFIALTNKLREKLMVNKGDRVEITTADGEVNITDEEK